MNLDIYLQFASISLTVLLAYIAIEMANNPPDKSDSHKKWIYRSVFFGFGLLLIGVNCWQATRNANEQLQTKQDALKEQGLIEAQYNQVQGKLDNIAQFTAHPPPSFSSAQLSAVIRALAVRPDVPGDVINELNNRVDATDTIIAACSNSGPPGSGGGPPEDCKKSIDSWTNATRKYILGSLGRDYEDRFNKAGFPKNFVSPRHTVLEAGVSAELDLPVRGFEARVAMLKQIIGELKQPRPAH